MRMWKRWLLLCVVFTAAIACMGAGMAPSSAAMGETPLPDTEQEVAAQLPSDLVEKQKYLEKYIRSFPELNWDRARQVYAFDAQSFLTALKSDTLEEEIVSKTFIWKVPISLNDQGAAYAIAGITNGEPGYVTVHTDLGGAKEVQYLFEETSIPIEIAEEAESSYMASVVDYNLDLMIVSSNEELTMIPFAAKPNLLKLENGTVYSSDEILSALLAYEKSIARRLSDGILGIILGVVPVWIPVLVIVLLCFCVWIGLVWCKKRRSA